MFMYCCMYIQNLYIKLYLVVVFCTVVYCIVLYCKAAIQLAVRTGFKRSCILSHLNFGTYIASWNQLILRFLYSCLCIVLLFQFKSIPNSLLVCLFTCFFVNVFSYNNNLFQLQS